MTTQRILSPEERERIARAYGAVRVPEVATVVRQRPIEEAIAAGPPPIAGAQWRQRRHPKVEARRERVRALCDGTRSQPQIAAEMRIPVSQVASDILWLRDHGFVPKWPKNPGSTEWWRARRRITATPPGGRNA